MKIEIPHVFTSTGTQPTTGTLLAANPKRVDAIITANNAGPFYIKRGTSASSTDYTYMLTFVGQMISVENYTGVLSISPAPTAGQVNVCEGTGEYP